MASQDISRSAWEKYGGPPFNDGYPCDKLLYITAPEWKTHHGNVVLSSILIGYCNVSVLLDQG